MAYLVYDLETGIHRYLKRKASRWHPDNFISALGWKKQGDKSCSWRYCKSPEDDQNLHIPEDVTLLVGFNLKFDLLWQWDNPELKAFFKRGGRIWDCQYVEYLLHGMSPSYHYPELNEVAPRYGGTTKIDEVKILWDQGINTPDIDEDLLIDYLVGTPEENRNAGDVGNTEKVFVGQLKKAQEMGMLEAIKSRMDGLCATTEMEWNGLYIDLKEARKQLIELTQERKEIKNDMDGYIGELPEGLEFKWTSLYHKSALLFGGTVKYRVRGPYKDPETGDWKRHKVKTRHYLKEDGSVGDPAPDDYLDVIPPLNALRFKSGKNKGLPKTKLVVTEGDKKIKWLDKTYTFPGYTKPLAMWETKLRDAEDKPIYKTSGEVVEALAGTGIGFCERLGRYEELNKIINTYLLTKDDKGNVSGMLSCVDRETHLIHHMLNHTSTVTSRLSSSDPNLQNVPRADTSDIKRVFSSRWGDDGCMLEADYSQLEVVVQGVLSDDHQLKEDLKNKIDFHCKRVAIQPAYSITYEQVKEIIANEDHPDHSVWKSRRTKAKIFSFQRAYGAGASLIALSTGMDVEEVKELIVAEELTYPGVKRFNDEVERLVKENCTPFYDPTEGKPFRRGTWTAPTGCVYTFRSYPAQDWQKDRGIEDSFSPTEMKNYPIQGTGGEIVQGICGELWRHFVANDNYGGNALLCNTVHDCIWIDMHRDVHDEVVVDVKEIMERVPEWFSRFNVDVDVPFPVEVETGPNMLELRHVA